LALQPGASYTVSISANYTSIQNGAGQLEPLTIETTLPCTLAIQNPNWLQPRTTQWCSYPATILPHHVLRADPFICGAINYTFRFTLANDCAGNTTNSSFDITNSSRNLYLNFNGSTTIPNGQTIQPSSYYNVSIRPNFGVGGSIPGLFGPSRTIFVGSTSSMVEFPSEDTTDEILNNSAELLVYPNPVLSGEMTIQTSHFMNENVIMTIFDQTGREIYRDQFEVNSELRYALATEDLFANGMYYVKMAGKNSQLIESFIIQK
jgi:Secretion system C-terminal sorting domain